MPNEYARRLPAAEDHDAGCQRGDAECGADATHEQTPIAVPSFERRGCSHAGRRASVARGLPRQEDVGA